MENSLEHVPSCNKCFIHKGNCCQSLLIPDRETFAKLAFLSKWQLLNEAEWDMKNSADL